MSLFTRIFGDPNERIVKELRAVVAQVNARESTYSAMPNDELKEQTLIFRKKLTEGTATLDTLLPDAFAVCREMAKRKLGQRHFDVQLMGGVALHRGNIAEMRTGEGKTLTATAPVYLNALEGKGVHLVTVNDYLAMRDAVWMGQVYYALGLSVGCIQHEAAYLYDPSYKIEKKPEEEQTEAEKEQDTEGAFRIQHDFMRPCDRKEAYAADVLYGTNNEFGFDYLRDNLAATNTQMVQRTLHYAIVDEVDSILIDEARTPLIISAPAEESAQDYYLYAKYVAQLVEGEDYNIDEKLRASTLTEAGLLKMEQLLGMKDFYTTAGVRTVHHIEQALKAHALFKRDKDYVVKDNEVIIVDEFTGRLMQGRRYSEGLHQAIEAKEGVTIQRESQTHATITFQNLFRLYNKLSGMTGTAATEAEEFAKIYKREVVTIPTHRGTVRKDLPDRVYRSEAGKFKAVVEEIRTRHEKGQPVLVGTGSIAKNEILAKLLEKEGIPHQVLNAKNHEREGEIIAQAGRLGGVTIATNMAGRGVDILLGGNPPTKEEAEKVRALGGLFVLGTERHESRRIDNQLRGRAGRQGDPGETQFAVSLEDDLMRIFGSDRIKGLMERLGVPEDMPIENKMITRSLEEAQKKVEGHNFDTRKHVVEYDDVINKHREVIYRKRHELLDAYDREIKAINAQEEVSGTTLRSLIMTAVEDEIEKLVLFHTASEHEGEWNIQEIYESVHSMFPVPQEARIDLEGIQHTAGDKLADAHARTAIISYLLDLARKNYDAFEKHFMEQIHAVDASVNPATIVRQIEKDVYLRSLDSMWVEHLEAIDHLRTGIGLRGYGQRDPLVEYKKEAYRLFNELLALINKHVVYTIFKLAITTPVIPPAEEASSLPMNVTLSAPAKEGDATGTATQQVAASPSAQGASYERVGRNDLCPCGSGKKYKKCHGA